MKNRNSLLTALLACLISAPASAAPIEGELVGWGYNYSGQTNVPPGNDFVAVDVGDFHGLALKSGGSLVGWGTDDNGGLIVAAVVDFLAIDGRGDKSVALKTDGSLVAWGG